MVVPEWKLRISAAQKTKSLLIKTIKSYCLGKNIFQAKTPKLLLSWSPAASLSFLD